MPLLFTTLEKPVAIRSNQSFRLNGTLLHVSLDSLKTVHVQQIVQKVQDMPAHDSDIGQVMVSPFPITDIRRQFRAAVDDIQRGAYIVRDGKDDILACFQQFIVLVYDTFHLVPELCIPFQMLVDNQVREYQQDDCRDYQPHDDGGRVIVRLRNISFSVLEGGLCVIVDASEQGEEFPVQILVTDTQAVGVALHIAYSLR